MTRDRECSKADRHPGGNGADHDPHAQLDSRSRASGSEKINWATLMIPSPGSDRWSIRTAAAAVKRVRAAPYRAAVGGNAN
jgi:hypothetical protein